MRIPTPVVVLFLAAWMSLQGFTLFALYQLNAEVAAQKALLQEHIRFTAVVLPG